MSQYDEQLDEGPSEADIERFSGETRSCPACGSEVYDESDLCHTCGHAFTSTDGRLRIWHGLIAVGMIALIVVIFVL